MLPRPRLLSFLNPLFLCDKKTADSAFSLFVTQEETAKDG